MSAIIITGIVAGMNAFLATSGSIGILPEWRGNFSVAGMIVIAVTAVAMVTGVPCFPPILQALAITVLASGWASARFILDAPTLESLIGKPASNVPLEVALIVFAGSRLWRWPEPFVISLAIVAYASHVALPMGPLSSVRDMLVTFSFVLFACLVTTWFIQGWRGHAQGADGKRDGPGPEHHPGVAEGLS